jgi:hypothetical protein
MCDSEAGSFFPMNIEFAYGPKSRAGVDRASNEPKQSRRRGIATPEKAITAAATSSVAGAAVGGPVFGQAVQAAAAGATGSVTQALNQDCFD